MLATHFFARQALARAARLTADAVGDIERSLRSMIFAPPRSTVQRPSADRMSRTWARAPQTERRPHAALTTNWAQNKTYLLHDGLASAVANPSNPMALDREFGADSEHRRLASGGGEGSGRVAWPQS